MEWGFARAAARSCLVVSRAIFRPRCGAAAFALLGHGRRRACGLVARCGACDRVARRGAADGCVGRRGTADSYARCAAGPQVGVVGKRVYGTGSAKPGAYTKSRRRWTAAAFDSYHTL